MAQWNRCWYCGCKLKFTSKEGPRKATVDHVVPQSRGGHKMVNACKQCNNLKSESSIEEFRVWLGIDRFYGEEQGWESW